MPSTNQIIAASSDGDLIARLSALAAQKGIASPEAWVRSNMSRIVGQTVEVSGQQTDVATVFEFAVASYEPTPPPGADDTKVTDALLEAAVDAAIPGTAIPVAPAEEG